MRIALILSVLYLHLFALHVTKFTSDVANGKTAFIEFAKDPNVDYKSISVGKKEFPIICITGEKQRYFALLPVGYYEKAAAKEIVVHYKQRQHAKKMILHLDVVQGKYASEEIKVDSSKVNPKGKEVQKRISREYHEAMKIYNTVTPKLYIKKPFIFPLESKITSDFGKARVYNGSLKGYHSGTDFRAKVGTPIRASNDGRVVLVKNRFYSGGTVVIDHGEGIYTCYFHMSAFRVKKGDMLKRGDIIGLSGQSGRVTGPHLHFSARISGVQVDPLQLIALLNDNILKGRQ